MFITLIQRAICVAALATLGVCVSAVSLGAEPLNLACPAPAGNVGTPYHSSLNVTGGTPAYTFSTQDGGLPAGLELDAATGTIAGTPTLAGDFAFIARAVDSAVPVPETTTVACIVRIGARLPLGVDGPSRTAQVGLAYESAFVAYGGYPPYRYNTGGLPPGLTYSSTTGAVVGIPTASGSFTFTICVDDQQSPQVCRNWAIVVSPIPQLTMQCHVSNGAAGVPYSGALEVSGGLAPYVFSLEAGELPAGLTLNQSTGEISGTPIQLGTTNFVGKVVDSGIPTPSTKLVPCAITIGPAPGTVQLSTTPNPSVYGEAVTLTASIGPLGAGGTVTFYDSQAIVGTAEVVNGQAGIARSTLDPGEHTLTAAYSGDAENGPASSQTILQTVERAQTEAAVGTSVSPSVFTQLVQAIAHVSAVVPSTATPEGVVQFLVDGVDQGAPVPLEGGMASLPMSNLEAGSHAITVSYAGSPRFEPSTSPPLTQTVVPADPVITNVRDVPNDQGGYVFITWRCDLDKPTIPTVTGYRVWRRIPVWVATGALSGTQVTHGVVGATAQISGDDTYWEAIDDLPAARLTHYGYTAATTQDSIAGSNPYTAFLVQALTEDSEVFYLSAPDSGYSVDNLAPPAPLPFVAQYLPTETVLRWLPSRAADVREYRLYKGDAPDFEPGPTTLVVVTSDTVYSDTPGQSSYKLAAVDVHGNLSRFVSVSPEAPTATLIAVAGIAAWVDRVQLRWHTSGDGSLRASVYRRTPMSTWQKLGEITPDGSGYMVYEDTAVQPGERYGYRLGVMDGGEEIIGGEVWAETPSARLTLEGVSPNPARGRELTVRFVLASHEPATLELHDLLGRRVGQREVGALGPGRHSVRLGADGDLAPGIYLVRLHQGAASQTTRAVVLR